MLSVMCELLICRVDQGMHVVCIEVVQIPRFQMVEIDQIIGRAMEHAQIKPTHHPRRLPEVVNPNRAGERRTPSWRSAEMPAHGREGNLKTRDPLAFIPVIVK